jgi:hypothetical protein
MTLDYCMAHDSCSYGAEQPRYVSSNFVKYTCAQALSCFIHNNMCVLQGIRDVDVFHVTIHICEGGVKQELFLG